MLLPYITYYTIFIGGIFIMVYVYQHYLHYFICHWLIFDAILVYKTAHKTVLFNMNFGVKPMEFYEIIIIRNYVVCLKAVKDTRV